MSHVQAIKNQFERLNVSDSDATQTFRRSATLTDFDSCRRNGDSPQFQRQDSHSKSVRRRGAFRCEKKPELVKSPPKLPCDINEELQYLATSETIKKALRQPLPQGSPPKKPPRTFAATPHTSPTCELKNIVAHSPPSSPPKSAKLKDGLKLLNCIPALCAVEPIYYEAIRAASPQNEENEDIYMEPQLLSVVTKTKPEELHYMCTNIIDQSFNSAHESSSLDSFSDDTQTESHSMNKLNILMDVMYDEKRRDRMLDDDSSSSSTEVKLPKGKVTRSLTEKRKNYVRRMTQSITAGDLIESPATASASTVIKQFQRIIDLNSGDRDEIDGSEVKLFKMSLLVGYDVLNKKGYVKSIYPKDVKPLPMLEQFVYPTDKNPCDLMTKENQNFRLILTDEFGNHLFGYCRQIIPEGFEKCLPLTYCIITHLNASGFFFTLLAEIESRHGISSQQFSAMMRSLHSQPFPKCGEIFAVKLAQPPPNVPHKKPELEVIQRSAQKLAKRLSLESPEWLKTAEASRIAGQLNGRSDEIRIRREVDARSENHELTVLYESTSRDLLVAIFGTLLIERKVIVVGASLSQVSACVMALYSLLYPFRWQHPIVAVTPEKIGELLQAPFPFFAGVLKSSVNVNSLEIEDGIVVDLETKSLVRKCGDEATLLPETLRKSLLLSLKIVEVIERGQKLVNVLIAEAFLQFFVKLFAELSVSEFDKEKFIESHSDQGIKYFLEWFLDTILFKEFLVKKREYERQKDALGTFELFESKVLGKSATLKSSQQKKNVDALLKNSKHKKRNFKDKIKDFLSSH